MGIPYTIDVNGNWSFDLKPDALKAYDSTRLGPDTFHILKESRPFILQIIESDFDLKTYRIEVNGTTYTSRISNDLDQLVAQMGFELQTSKNVTHIEAPMPGLILDIQVSEGQEVKEGDALLVLEAMKMENVILSPRDGVIKTISVEKGSAVDKKNLLVEFE